MKTKSLYSKYTFGQKYFVSFPLCTQRSVAHNKISERTNTGNNSDAIKSNSCTHIPQRHTPVIQVLLLLVATSGSVIVASRRTRTAGVRKLIIQTPGGGGGRIQWKEGRKEGRKVVSGKWSGGISADSWQGSFGSDSGSRAGRTVCSTSETHFISRWTVPCLPKKLPFLLSLSVE